MFRLDAFVTSLNVFRSIFGSFRSALFSLTLGPYIGPPVGLVLRSFSVLVPTVALSNLTDCISYILALATSLFPFFVFLKSLLGLLTPRSFDNWNPAILLPTLLTIVAFSPPFLLFPSSTPLLIFL